MEDGGERHTVDSAELRGGVLRRSTGRGARSNRFEIHTTAPTRLRLARMPPAWACSAVEPRAGRLSWGSSPTSGSRRHGERPVEILAGRLWRAPAGGRRVTELDRVGRHRARPCSGRWSRSSRSARSRPEHAYAEGESRTTLWRRIHAGFRTFARHDRGFEPDMPIVCELRGAPSHSSRSAWTPPA